MKSKSIVLLLLSAILAQGVNAAGYNLETGGVVVSTSNGDVRLKVIDEKIIRVSATPNDSFPEDASLVVLPTKGTPEYTVTATDGNVNITTSEIKAVVSEKTGAVTFYDKTGKKILQEKQNGRTFNGISVDGTDGYTVRQIFESLNDDEGLYGLGQHQANEFNYKGKNEELFQYNTKVSVPFIVSTDNYGILWDSYSLCR